MVEAETSTKNNSLNASVPKLLHIMTKEQEEVFCEYQIKATSKAIKRQQNRTATALERIGHKVVSG